MTEIRYPEHGSPARSTDIYEWQGHRGEVLDTVQGSDGLEYRVIRCQGCILTHVAPIPSDDWLEDYYRSRFYQSSKPDYVSRYEEDRGWWQLWHQVTINQALMLLRGSDAHADEQSWERTYHCLDIGTGPGIFLDVAKRSGWSTYGLEINKELQQRALGHEHLVYAKSLQAFLTNDFEPGSPGFDFVHAYEVLEHVPQPDVFLEQCYEMLKPGGVIAITVPNDYSTLQMAACKQFNLPRWWVAPPEHLNYFSPKTLQLLIRRSGFTIRELRGTFPLETFLFMGRPYVGNDEIGRVCHHERVRYEMNMAKAGLMDWLLDQYRHNVEHSYSYAVGREIVAIAQKE